MTAAELLGLAPCAAAVRRVHERDTTEPIDRSGKGAAARSAATYSITHNVAGRAAQ
jgi:hypothetical protein